MGTQGSVPQCATKACLKADVNSENLGYQQNKPILRNDLAVSKAISPTRSEARDTPLANQEAQPYAQVEPSSPEPVPEPVKPAQESVPKAPVIEEQNPVVTQEGPTPGMYEITLMRSLEEKWGMDVDYGQGPSLKVGAVHDSGPVADYNDKNPKRPLEANDRIVEIDGEEKTARQMAMHLAQDDVVSLSLIIRKPPVKAEEAPCELDVQVVREDSSPPGMYGLTLTRSLGEKWGMEVDFGRGPNLKIESIHDSGPVANYNDNNPKRLVEANDWIVEIGELNTAKQMAMLLAETDLVSISLIIRKHFTVDEKGNNRKD